MKGRRHPTRESPTSPPPKREPTPRPEYRAIKEELLAEGLACVSGRVTSWRDVARLHVGLFAGETYVDISVALVTALVENILEVDPFCDHSVGICMCDTRQVLEDLQLWLDHKERCPECNGEGFKFNEAKYAAAVERYRAEGFEADPGDAAGYESCPDTVAIQ